MTSYQPDKAAALLHESSQRGAACSPAQDTAPRTKWRVRLSSMRWPAVLGQRHLRGFKIGATAKRMQDYLGLSGPAAGFMAAGNMYRSGVDIRLAEFVRPGRRV